MYICLSKRLPGKTQMLQCVLDELAQQQVDLGRQCAQCQSVWIAGRLCWPLSRFRLSEAPLKQCSGCARVFYCSKSCQKQHWRAQHKNECASRRRRCLQQVCTVLIPPLAQLVCDYALAKWKLLRHLPTEILIPGDLTGWHTAKHIWCFTSKHEPYNCFVDEYGKSVERPSYHDDEDHHWLGPRFQDTKEVALCLKLPQYLIKKAISVGPFQATVVASPGPVAPAVNDMVLGTTDHLEETRVKLPGKVLDIGLGDSQVLIQLDIGLGPFEFALQIWQRESDDGSLRKPL